MGLLRFAVGPGKASNIRPSRVSAVFTITTSDPPSNNVRSGRKVHWLLDRRKSAERQNLLDRALIEAGLDLNLSPTATLGASYSGQFASDVEDNAVKGRFTWLF